MTAPLCSYCRIRFLDVAGHCTYCGPAGRVPVPVAQPPRICAGCGKRPAAPKRAVCWNCLSKGTPPKPRGTPAHKMTPAELDELVESRYPTMPDKDGLAAGTARQRRREKTTIRFIRGKGKRK